MVAKTTAQSAVPSQSLSPAERSTALDRLVTLIDERFAVPDEGATLVTELKERIAQGAYDCLATIGEFAEELTKDIQRISNDGHMKEEDENDDMKEWLHKQRFLNQGIEEIRMLPANIGYFNLLSFPSPESAAKAYAALFTLFEHTNGLIIDIRKNTGGSVAADLLASYLTKSSQRATVSTLHRYSGAKATLHLHPTVAGPRYGVDRPVWVLTSKTTFSAAEHFAHVVKALGRVRIVGENTGGGGRMCDDFWIHPHIDACISVAFVRCEIDQKVWERVGVEPHVSCEADKALDVALLEALERFVPAVEADHAIMDLERYTFWADKTGVRTLAKLRAQAKQGGQIAATVV
ncbi:hypothetical protein HDU87_005589 [Geranomyces variabilis]|uniref:Tail specific protease domain-containing protein n=1 Tax=Geranomyces variabilis TaxID=109894 RepID=A0AAD5XPJ1_9FUNG|nr:hypothetical protein HDU87_005589 [Geranomyces variabilis]